MHMDTRKHTYAHTPTHMHARTHATHEHTHTLRYCISSPTKNCMIIIVGHEKHTIMDK